MKKWLIKWQCNYCHTEFTEERTAVNEEALLATEFRSGITCNLCNHVSYDNDKAQYIELPPTYNGLDLFEAAKEWRNQKHGLRSFISEKFRTFFIGE